MWTRQAASGGRQRAERGQAGGAAPEGQLGRPWKSVAQAQGPCAKAQRWGHAWTAQGTRGRPRLTRVPGDAKSPSTHREVGKHKPSVRRCRRRRRCRESGPEAAHQLVPKQQHNRNRTSRTNPDPVHIHQFSDVDPRLGVKKPPEGKQEATTHKRRKGQIRLHQDSNHAFLKDNTKEKKKTI